MSQVIGTVINSAAQAEAELRSRMASLNPMPTSPARLTQEDQLAIETFITSPGIEYVLAMIHAKQLGLMRQEIRNGREKDAYAHNECAYLLEKLRGDLLTVMRQVVTKQSGAAKE